MIALGIGLLGVVGVGVGAVAYAAASLFVASPYLAGLVPVSLACGAFSVVVGGAAQWGR